jgi:HSP20 family protein
MTTLTRWSPVSGLAELEINRLERMFQAAFPTEALARGAWMPAVDIFETADNTVVLKAELPEMKREDIKVTVENNTLTIEGERTFTNASDSDKYHRVERGYGAFSRRVTVPNTVDAAKVEATYQDGVLTVKLPRREESKARQIQINQ